MRSITLPLLAALLCSAQACASSDPPTVLTRQELMKPETCKTCHPAQYQEWKSSMHAYASDDPVFLAMNKKGQLDAKLGTFCVNCHAPMAVREGLTMTGENLASLPQEMKGVTCYFCHNVAQVTGDHNAMLDLANDTTMRAEIKDPIDPKVHQAAYSELLDGDRVESANMCGGCHDIVTPSGVHLERTFAEWKGSVFGKPGGINTCAQCHMDRYVGAAAPGDTDAPVLTRNVFRHSFAAVDSAFAGPDGNITWPDAKAHQAAIGCAQQTGAQIFQMCPHQDASGNPNPLQFAMDLETNGGHDFPSGAAHDRRAWVELIAYDANDQVIYSTGVRKQGEVVERSDGTDPDLKIMRDYIYGADGQEVHMFWEAAPSAAYPNGYDESTLLKPAKMPPPMNSGGGPPPHSIRVSFPVPPNAARVRARMLIQPVGREVLDLLAADPNLGFSPQQAASIPTITLDADVVEWTKADGEGCVKKREESPHCPKSYEDLYSASAAAAQTNAATQANAAGQPNMAMPPTNAAAQPNM